MLIVFKLGMTVVVVVVVDLINVGFTEVVPTNMTVGLCMVYILMVVLMTLTMMQGHSGLAGEGHGKFYLSPESSVAFFLNYGHTSTSFN